MAGVADDNFVPGNSRFELRVSEVDLLNAEASIYFVVSEPAAGPRLQGKEMQRENTEKSSRQCLQITAVISGNASIILC